VAVTAASRLNAGSACRGEAGLAFETEIPALAGWNRFLQ